MPTTKNQISNAKSVLCWGSVDPDYKDWRTAVHTYCISNGIVGKAQAGKALWDNLAAHAASVPGFKESAKTLIGRGSKEACGALDKILQDACKKESERAKTNALQRVVNRVNTMPDALANPLHVAERAVDRRRATRTWGCDLFGRSR